MKMIQLVRWVTIVPIMAMALSACSAELDIETVEMELELTGDMLFEGSNTLQYSGADQLTEAAGLAGVAEGTVKAVHVDIATIELRGASREITESLLLQIVSDNKELVTIGTLNPLPKGDLLTLTLAEDPEILPYLKDSGTTWVLDLNITEDHMDELIITAKVQLRVESLANKN